MNDLTKKINSTLAELCVKYSKDIKNIEEITAPQIRKILLTFKDALGENPEWTAYEKELIEIATNLQIQQDKYPDPSQARMMDMIEKAYEAHIILEKRKWLPETLSEALCQKLVDGLTPRFDFDPNEVLTELLNNLDKINK